MVILLKTASIIEWFRKSDFRADTVFSKSFHMFLATFMKPSFIPTTIATVGKTSTVPTAKHVPMSSNTAE